MSVQAAAVEAMAGEEEATGETVGVVGVVGGMAVGALEATGHRHSSRSSKATPHHSKVC